MSIATKRYNRNATTDTPIAPMNPVLCRALIINHITMRTIIHATKPEMNRNVIANIIVIIKEVTKTSPNESCLDLLKKLSAIAKNMLIITRKIR